MESANPDWLGSGMEVHRDGRVFNRDKGRWLTLSRDTHGYLYFTHRPYLRKTKNQSVHRAVAILFMLNPNNYPCVNHIDGNKENNNIENLEWCTVKHNVQHAHRLGLCNPPRGEQHHKSKLTEEEVRFIKFKSDDISEKLLAKKFQCSFSCIYDIRKGRRWAHIENKIEE